MDIEQNLLREHSKALTLKIAGWIGRDPARMREFIEVFARGDKLVAQRASWVIGKVTDVHPEMFIPHLSTLIAAMKKPGAHDAVKRNITRLLQVVEIPRRLEGTVVSVCFDLLASPDESIAAKVNAMSVIARFCTREPDLEKELRLLVSEQLPRSGGAFRSRARHLLNMSAPLQAADDAW